jgi:hypothetical protein
MLEKDTLNNTSERGLCLRYNFKLSSGLSERFHWWTYATLRARLHIDTAP